VHLSLRHAEEDACHALLRNDRGVRSGGERERGDDRDDGAHDAQG
jgi:hypothetical protein